MLSKDRHAEKNDGQTLIAASWKSKKWFSLVLGIKFKWDLIDNNRLIDVVSGQLFKIYYHSTPSLRV